VHVITQILGLLAAIGGVIIAILAFGWKDVPGQQLYLPHKWTGVGVIGMALVQVRVLHKTCKFLIRCMAIMIVTFPTTVGLCHDLSTACELPLPVQQADQELLQLLKIP
jgi:hypothetical protein